MNADGIVPLRTIVEITTPRNRRAARLRCGRERACERPGVAAPERGSATAQRPAMSAAACYLVAAVTLLLGLACGVALGRRSRSSAVGGGPARAPAPPVRLAPESGPDATRGPSLADLLLRVFRSSDAGLAVLTR